MRFSDLPERVREVRERIDAAVVRGGHGQRVTVVAVTKTHGPDAAEAAWEAGLPDVGENRVQEALEKMDAVRAAVRWHLIGHLQRNKAKYVTRFALVHSIDSARVADAVNEVGCGSGHPIDVLLQANVVGEATVRSRVAVVGLLAQEAEARRSRVGQHEVVALRPGRPESVHPPRE